MKSTHLFRFGATALACALTVVACGSGSETASVTARKTKNGAITTAETPVELSPERTGRVSPRGEPIINYPYYGNCDIAYDVLGRWRACTSMISMAGVFVFENSGLPPTPGPYYPSQSSRYEWVYVTPPEGASHLVYNIMLTTGQVIKGVVRFVPKSSPQAAGYVATTTLPPTTSTSTSSTSSTTTTVSNNCMIRATQTSIQVCKPANWIKLAPMIFIRQPKFETYYRGAYTASTVPGVPQSYTTFEYPFVIPGDFKQLGRTFEAIRFTVLFQDGTSIIDGLGATNGIPEQFYPSVFNGRRRSGTILPLYEN